MIISGIPFRLWEKVIRFGTAFFFITTLISPFLILILYFFEADFDLSFGKKSQKNPFEKKYSKSKVTLSTNKDFLEKQNNVYVPIPDLESTIMFIDYNYRPDKQGSSADTILLSIGNKTLLTKERACIYLDCSDPSNIKFSAQKTPFSLTPISLKGNGLELNFELCYLNKSNEPIYKTSSKVLLEKSSKNKSLLSSEAKAALKSLESAKSFKEDALLSMMGGKLYEQAKHCPRIQFGGKIATPFTYVKERESFCFENNNWVKTSTNTAHKPLFVVKSIKNNQIEGIFWNESGFFEKNMTITSPPTSKSTLSSFTFEKIYKRNNESVIVQINGKTLILKTHDWLSKKDNSWNHVVHLNDFNDIIEGKSLKELLIFEKIEREKEKEFFVGYLFDACRQEFRKLQIPLTQKESLLYTK